MENKKGKRYSELHHDQEASRPWQRRMKNNTQTIGLTTEPLIESNIRSTPNSGPGLK